MKTRLAKRLVGGAIGAALFTATLISTHATKPVAEHRPVVQVAILLDTSGSMQGLIEQAKGQLWKIVNEFISARQNGKLPEVQVALFEYGKSTLPASEGFIRMIQPLTTDLDKISEELFALKTNGGDEYCGWVIKEAVNRLTWSKSPDVYRAIFIAGNEPFTQGSVNYADACKLAVGNGIVVNTIHCGNASQGINTKWQAGALLADGKFMTIDQNQAVAHFEAPQDAEILRLSTALNSTYVAFGRYGSESSVRQVTQDANAASLAPQGAAVNRAVAKASINYRNSNWDLVDAVKEKKVKLEELKADELPENLKKLDVKERKDYLEKKSQERAELQNQINDLNNKRSEFLADKVMKSTNNTLDAAIVNAVREQAAKRNYTFK
ncbi:MAG: vWA domain-containing protein [Limisphaerales bacterium]